MLGLPYRTFPLSAANGAGFVFRCTALSIPPSFPRFFRKRIGGKAGDGAGREGPEAGCPDGPYGLWFETLIAYRRIGWKQPEKRIVWKGR